MILIFSIIFFSLSFLTSIYFVYYSYKNKSKLLEADASYKLSKIKPKPITSPDEPIYTSNFIVKQEFPQGVKVGRRSGSLVFDVNVIYEGINNDELQISEIEKISKDIVLEIKKNKETEIPNTVRMVTINGISVLVDIIKWQNIDESIKRLDTDEEDLKSTF